MEHESECVAEARLILLLMGVVLLGVGIQVWLVPVTEAEMTPAQESLLNIGDWVVKVSVGAMLGFGGARLASRNGGSDQG